MQIKEIIVVEGKSDTRRLKEIYPEINTIETNGSAIDDRIIDAIRYAQASRGVIIFTDPDFQGEKIRRIINEQVPGCKNAYMKKALAIDDRKHKVGIEHCTAEDICQALAEITVTKDGGTDIEYMDLYDLKIIGGANSRALREYLSDALHLGYNNAKQFYHKLQIYGISKERIKNLVQEYEKTVQVNSHE